MQGAIALLVILGVSYIFMFFMLNGQVTKQIVAYFFIIFNALQGLIKFRFELIMNEKNRRVDIHLSCTAKG